VESGCDCSQPETVMILLLQIMRSRNSIGAVVCCAEHQRILGRAVTGCPYVYFFPNCLVFNNQMHYEVDTLLSSFCICDAVSRNQALGQNCKNDVFVYFCRAF